jgi:glycosyltransferase involved in cell wall biosynthesis
MSRTMPIIGIDYTPANEQGGGIGRYVRDLIGALGRLDTETAYRLFVAGANKSQLSQPPGTNFRWTPVPLSTEWLARLWQRARLPIPVNVWTGALDLYHATDFVLPPVARGTRTLLTVHDLSFVRAPETASPNLRAYLDQVVPRSVRRADHVLADSEATKADLVALYGTPADKITVLLSGVSDHFAPITDSAKIAAMRAKYKIGDTPYMLAVGTVQPRKNFERLIRVLATLPDSLADVKLVIVGGRGWLQGPIYQAVADLKLSERVIFTGFADDADLPTLYSGARLLAYPSLYEGFGLPILEAMRCGIPVLSARASSLPEVAGEAALLVDPTDNEAIRDGLIRLLTDDILRQRLIAAGFVQSQPFTWDRAARQLQQVYRGLISSV